MTYLTNTRHVGTYLSAFSTVIPNIVLKLNNFDIFNNFGNMSSALACLVVSVNIHKMWIGLEYEIDTP